MKKFNLLELPRDDVIFQIHRNFRNNNLSFAQVMPDLQVLYFSFRVWHYIGGNMRDLKEAFSQHKSGWEKYYCKVQW